MTNLTAEQKDQFARATSVWNTGGDAAQFNVRSDDNFAMICDPDEVADVGDTLEDFTLWHGAANEVEETPAGRLYVWRNVQADKGKRRGDLFVMDFDSRRAAYFTGES